MTITTNASGSRSIEISDQHMLTLRQYNLLQGLADSNGIVDEQVLDKLRLSVRALLESEAGADKALLDLCLDVIYHPNMKALGLQNLMACYTDWDRQHPEDDGVSAL